MFFHSLLGYDWMTDRLLDAARAKTLFADAGISVAEWARTRGFSTGLVYAVLDGQRKCLRGQSHRIAIALGLKQGLVMDVDEVSRSLVAASQVNHSGEQTTVK